MSFEAVNRRPRNIAMIWALIRKDARLLRVYLRFAIAATALCYVVMTLLAVIFTNFQDKQSQSVTHQAMLILIGGSNAGFGITYFFAALISGSVFTLERSDRSAEFLDCLPPTRMQNLTSKLTVVIAATAAMIIVHLSTAWAANLLLPFVRKEGGFFPAERLPSVLNSMSFVGVIVSVVGGAVAVSAWQKSNGVPILCGLLTPALVASIASFIAWALDIPFEPDAFVMRYATSSLVLGFTFGYLGGFWYLKRSEW
jgi:ABC-type transport system involved in multi-copper enzyme maturation permease subunit